MAFDKRSAATKYQPQDGDTLAKIAEREAAAGNPLTAEDIARFNWGTDDPDVIDEHLRDELGCHRRGADKGFVISTDVEARSDLLLPVAFKKAGLGTDTPITLRVKKQPAPPEQFEGCAKISGVTFEFDKSFVRPSVVDDLKKVETALSGHPEAKVLIFGHTDKVGSETYNKKLSERRALSVYAFVTNQPAIWEDLYKEESWGLKAVQEILKDMGGAYDPGPVDGVDGPKTRAAVKQFQTDNGLAVDGVAGPNTRAKLFAAYMAGKHDIEIDDARFMDPKHMGCGEFNPVVETEEPNEENRRVTFFLFNEGRLPRIPCKHGDLGPCNKQKDPPLPRFKDDFHCSFYDSIAKNCGNEIGPVPPQKPAATIEIIDASDKVLTAVQIGLWDHAFDATGKVFNTATEADHFAGADTRRFHFRVKDPAATATSVNIEWKSLDAGGADLDSAGLQLTLVETPAGSKTFVSKGLLLCCDLDDVKQPTNSGLAAPLPDVGDRNRGQSNHRLKTAVLDGSVKGTYTPASGSPAVSVALPVFERQPDKRRRLPLQVFILRVAPGGAPVVPIGPTDTFWTRDMRVIKETYERIGVKFETLVAAGTPANAIHSKDGLSIVEIDPIGQSAAGNPVPVANPANVTLADEQNLGRAFPATGHTVRVFVTGGMSSGNRGEAAPDVDFAGAPDVGTAFVDGPQMGPYTIAHETGHMLTNKSNAANGGHYKAPAAPAGNRFFNDQNLMRNGTSVGEGVSESKRLWDAADGDGLNGLQNTLASPYTRPF